MPSSAKTTREIEAGPEKLSADVLVIGGGFIGGTVAAALDGEGLSSIVVDRAPTEATLNAGADGRAFAISLTSSRLLKHIGVWAHIGEDATPMREIRVADQDSRLFLHYDHKDVGDEPFGFLVESPVLRRAVRQRLTETPSARLLAPAAVARIERGGKGVRARLEDGREITARVAIAADGRNSATREAARIRVSGWSYRRDGLICVIQHQKPHGFVAHEHFMAPGPFAILPLRGNRSGIVWTERPEVSRAVMALDDAGFTAELARRVGEFLGPIELEGKRWAYPLSLQYAWTMFGERLALAGDAAHAMHPIAGQGMNMGFRDVAALADVLGSAARAGEDIGAGAVLKRFEEARFFDNFAMLAATDGLNRLFTFNPPPVRLVRDLGLGLVNAIGPVRKAFMRHAMGISGSLPPLMRA